MPVYEIPTGPSPRTMRVALGPKIYGLRFAYADAPEGGWFMDISDANGVPLVCGASLVTGADLLDQYAYLGIPGRLYVVTDADPAAVPTRENLGVGSHLYFELI